MKSYETSAKTVEEAISQGLEHLGVAINDVTIDILSEGSKGLFGLFGSKQAKVRLTLKADVETEDASALISAAHEKAKSNFQVASKETVEKSEPVKHIPFPASKKAPLGKGEMADLLNKAQLFLKELTKHMAIEAEVTASISDEGSILLEMAGENMGLLIGRRGETLDALQYLTNLHVNRDQENYVRVALDTENYRAKREESLVRLANRMANRAVKTGRRVALEPMNPYERRVIHSALSGNRQVETHSEGDDPYRRLVITVKKK